MIFHSYVKLPEGIYWNMVIVNGSVARWWSLLMISGYDSRGKSTIWQHPPRNLQSYPMDILMFNEDKLCVNRIWISSWIGESYFKKNVQYGCSIRISVCSICWSYFKGLLNPAWQPSQWQRQLKSPGIGRLHVDLRSTVLWQNSGVPVRVVEMVHGGGLESLV